MSDGEDRGKHKSAEQFFLDSYYPWCVGKGEEEQGSRLSALSLSKESLGELRKSMSWALGKGAAEDE